MLQGTLPSVAYPQAMATELDRRDIWLFDYAKQFAQPFRDAIRARTELLAAEEGVEIEYIQRIEELPQGRPYPGDPGRARTSSRTGPYLLGHGALPVLRALARQADRQDLP